MQRTSKISNLTIVIPVYNEEKRISSCLKRMLEFCKNVNSELEVIIVDDGSIDKTVQIAKEFEASCRNIRVISWSDRRGKGMSVKGAGRLSSKDYICYMDADLATDPSEFGMLLSYKEDYDVVIGSRNIPGKRICKINRPFHRGFFSRGYSLAFRALFRAQIYDPQCGFKLFRRDVFLRIFDNMQSRSFAFDSEVLVTAILLGYRVKEVPISWRHVNGSKISVIRQATLMGKDLVSIWNNAYLFQCQSDMGYLDSISTRLCRGEILLKMKSYLAGDRPNRLLKKIPSQDIV